MIETKRKRLIRDMIGVYVVARSIYMIYRQSAMTGCVMEGPVNTWCYRILLIWGALLALFVGVEVIREKKLKSLLAPCNIVFAIFIVWMAFGVVYNSNPGFTDNLLGVVVFVIQWLLLYVSRFMWDEKRLKFWLKRIIFIDSVPWALMCLISIVQCVIGAQYRIYYSAEMPSLRQGFMEGRLFGTFTDPNFAALVSLLMVFGLFYLIRHTTYRILHIYAWIAIGLNVVYIVLSYSRTGYIVAVVSVLIFVFLYTFRENHKEHALKKYVTRMLVSLVAMIMIYLVSFFGIMFIGNALVPDRDMALEMTREDIIEENISNNRFTIWTEYLGLLMDRPATGFGLRGVHDYIEENYPNSYLALTKYSTHNSYITILVYTGIVGFILMIIFLLMSFGRFVGRMKTRRELSDELILFAVYIVILCVSSLSLSVVFFNFDLESMSMWAGLGLVNKPLGGKNEQEK